MKKFYFILSLLLALGGVTQLMAQETVTLNINKKTGDWTASGSPAYANEYATNNYSDTEITPGVRIQHWNRSGGHNNNMYFYDNMNLGIYSALGSTVSEDYRIYPSRGYYITNVSLDFVPGKHPDYAANGVRVWFDNEESEAIACAWGAAEPSHISFDLNKEQQYVTLTIGQAAENGNPIFAHTSNFQVTLTKRNPIDVIIDDIYTLISAYRPYTEGKPDAFIGGEDMGCYGVAEVAAFNAAYSECISKVDDPTWTGTLEEYQALYDNLKNAYEAVLASQITFTITNGYYRFRTGMNYNDGKLKYMYVNITDDNEIQGKWGTLENLDTNCHALWKLTKTEQGTWDIVSVSTDARFKKVAPVTLSEESTTRFDLEVVATIGENTYVDIKPSDIATGEYGYIHQAGHGSGAGTGGNLTLWYPTYSGTTMAGSEWVIELVPEDIAQEIIEAYSQSDEGLRREYMKMVETSKKNLEIAKDNPKVTINEEVVLITANSQFTSPFTCSADEEDPEKQGTDKLTDENLETYWHSTWAATVPNHTHYLDVTLNEPTHELTALTISRRKGAGNANHITQWGVYGSNDAVYKEAVLWTEGDELPDGVEIGDVKEPALLEGGEWHKLADLYTPYGGSDTETKTSAPFDTKGYKFLRFYIDQTSGQAGVQKGFGHVSEFQLNPATVEIADNAQYKVMGALATNLEKVLEDQIEVEVANLTKEQFNALKTAYDAFMAKFVDPAELRAAIKTAEASTASIIVGTNPGEWGPDTDAGDLATTVANAKEYDASGDYTPEQSANYVESLKASAGDIYASANKVKEGKWYRFHFGSKETFEANGWDIETNEPTSETDINDAAYITNEALWDKFITVAKHDAEEITIEVAHEPTEEDPSTSKEKEVTQNKVVPYDEEEDIVRGAVLYFDADADITDKDCSLFRFINVGDSAYVIQNKATGLYLRATSPVTLDITPALFDVSAIGYGQNVVHARALTNGANQNNLHFQRSNNVIVTYGDKTAGSRSGLYIQEDTDVTEDYDGSSFKMNLRPGEIYSFCYPVDLDVDPNDEEGKFYIVTALEIVYNEETTYDDVNITLSPLAVPNAAGYPVFYIYGNPASAPDGDYNPTDDAEPFTFKHGESFVSAPVETGFMKGTFSKLTVGKGYIVTGGNLIDIQQEGHAADFARNQFYVTSQNITNAVVANGVYVAGEELLNSGYDVTFTIGTEPVDDAVASVLTQTANRGDLYTIDGRLVGRNVTLKDLKRFGKGLYIIDGIKVTVK